MAPVEIRDLSKQYGDVAAVNHLSFDIEPVTGFLGPNGAGKSTTLRALLGLAQPSPARTQ
jgi:ABC-2 type transport system ATP-binding protein